MKQIRKVVRVILIILTGFLSLSAIAGCIQLLEGTYAPPVDMLQGSPFKDFTIPGLALGLIVGGSALFAAILLIRESRYAILSAAAAGIIIMFFEFVEMLVIGSPAGIARTLQIFYFSLGTLIAAISLASSFLDIVDEDHRA
jgi:hypothetical protein